MVKIVNQVDRSTTSVDYQTGGVKRIRVSNNLGALDVVGQTGDNAMLSSLKIARVGSNVSALMSGCFAGCENLEVADIPENCQYIGEEAFFGCTRLTSVNCIQGGGHPLKKIGKRGFARCNGLKDLTLDLAGNPAEMYEILGNECFASCENLETVKFTRSAYVSRRMFADCDSLTSIQLANTQGYMYPEGLADIKSLERISIPNKTWIVNDGTFSGCTSLSSVEFQDGDTADTSSNIELIGDAVFNGCDSLHELRLPKSITSFAQLGDNMLAGSQISCVRFDGIPREYFGEYEVEKKLTYNTGAWYIGKNKDTCATVLKIAKYANSNRIPMVIQLSRNESVATVEKKVNGKKKVVEYADAKWIAVQKNIQLNRNFFFLKSWYDVSYTSNLFNWLNPLCENKLSIDGDAGTTYLVMLWNSASGRKYEIFSNPSQNDGTNTNTRFNATLDRIFSGYVPPTTVIHEITETSKVSLLGLDTSCLYYASDGSYRTVMPDGKIKYSPKMLVDEYSTVNFKTGRWYYNASDLKAFADKYNIPVVVEYSSKGCTPCEYWAKNSFNNGDFQDWVSRQKYLFCRVEKKSSNESWEDAARSPQLNFVEYQWLNAQKRGIPYPPVFGWYWKRKDQSEPFCDVSSYHFAQGVGSQPPWTDEQFYQMTTDKFSEYRELAALAPGLSCPEITEHSTENGYPAYLSYENQYLSSLPSPLTNDYLEYDREYLFRDNENGYFGSLKQKWSGGNGPDWYNDLSGSSYPSESQRQALSDYIQNDVFKGEIDPNGVFFTCERKESIDQFDGTVTIQGLYSKPTKLEKPKVGQSYLVPDGTYQVFLAKNAYRYDQDSLVFRIRGSKLEYLFRCYNYIDLDADDVQTGYKTGEWVKFAGSAPGAPLASLISQAETKSTALVVAVHMNNEDTSVLEQIGDYVANSGIYWVDIGVFDRSEFNQQGTAANEFTLFTLRDYIGGWGDGYSSTTPMLYIYKGCSTCGIGAPAVYVHQAKPLLGMSASDITAWVESRKNEES